MQPANQAALEAIAVLNALVTMVSRAELQRRRAPTSRQTAQAAYLATAARQETHPLPARALAGRTETGPSHDARAQFERVIRRVLAGLLSPGPGAP